MAFPDDIDDDTDLPPRSSGQVISSAEENRERDAVQALEAKVGADDSADTDSLDFKVGDLQTQIDALVAPSHPDLATHDALGLATDTELDDEALAAQTYADATATAAAGTAQGNAQTYADDQDAAHLTDANPHPDYQEVADKGAPLGYATLDASGLVPGSQLSAVSVDGGLVGFYGVAPVARTVMATGTGKTVDNLITALQALGLFIQTGGGGGSGSLFDTGVFDTATYGAS